jgi:7-cyano-7-deazaguanine reductase
LSDSRTDILKTVDNPEPERDYEVTHTTDEFTFLYPLTEQPCFAQVEVTYRPGEHCVEMMSLKQYLQTFRDETGYFEAITNRLLDDLVTRIEPNEMTVTARFTVRGGISSVVKASSS